jgi:hypothetical protein
MTGGIIFVLRFWAERYLDESSVQPRKFKQQWDSDFPQTNQFEKTDNYLPEFLALGK